MNSTHASARRNTTQLVISKGLIKGSYGRYPTFHHRNINLKKSDSYSTYEQPSEIFYCFYWSTLHILVTHAVVPSTVSSPSQERTINPRLGPSHSL